MFDTLLSLPLFQGLSPDDLTRILESTRLDFDTVGQGTCLMKQDHPCEALTYVLQGDVALTTQSADRSWSVEETLAVPAVAGLDVLYGRRRNYRYSLTAREETRVLHMDKRTVGALVAYFEVFRINVLNMLTSSIARREQLTWLPAEIGLEGRIRSFMKTHVEHPAGQKVFYISQLQLGNYLGEDKRRISKALHHMQETGLLRLERRSIAVPHFEELMKHEFNN
ncbi:MAG: Crp/Fnr family transcriptional regulator [Bacteroidaceae bacterium]|nr:Crp/Fnr family transcriptional regulator [Bacteroidaceae bacterium]